MDAGEICELFLKTTKYTLIYVISLVFIGLNFAVIFGFGFFAYSSGNMEKKLICYANSISNCPFSNLSDAQIK